MAHAVRAHALRSAPPEALAAPALKDLPPAGTRHWVPRYKAAVVAAVDSGMLGLEDARQRYLLSEEELESWRDTIDRFGVPGLRMSVSERRGVERVAVSEPAVATVQVGRRVDCRITDVSDRGARLELPTKVVLPVLFELTCTKTDRSWWVDQAWQRNDAAGVTFSNPLPPPWAFRSGLGAWLVGQSDTVAIDRLD